VAWLAGEAEAPGRCPVPGFDHASMEQGNAM